MRGTSGRALQQAMFTLRLAVEAYCWSKPTDSTPSDNIEPAAEADACTASAAIKRDYIQLNMALMRCICTFGRSHNNVQLNAI